MLFPEDNITSTNLFQSNFVHVLIFLTSGFGIIEVQILSFIDGVTRPRDPKNMT